MGNALGSIAVALRLAIGLVAEKNSAGSAGNAAPDLGHPSHFRLIAVAPGAWAAIANERDRATVGNAGFVVGSTGVLVIDTFGTIEGAQELLGVIRAKTSVPVRWVVNTHYVPDHMGGNAVFQEAGAVVIGHEGARRWARKDSLKMHRENIGADRATLDALVLPDVATDESGTITLALGDRDALVLPRPCHTGGDLIVRVDSGDVVFTGDLFWKSTVPNLVDARTSAWVETLDGFLRDYPSASFVPGHGEVGRALDVRFFRDFLMALRQEVSRQIAGGVTGQALVDAVLETLRPRYGAWTWFSRLAATGTAETEKELRGTKTSATHFREKEVP